MTISLERAAQCIGRRVRGPQDYSGTLAAVDSHSVAVRNDRTGDTDIMIPEDLEWVSTLTPAITEAITEWEDYESVQAGFAAIVYRNDEDNGFSNGFSNLGIIYSGHAANDDGEDRALFAVAPMIRRVYPLSITANPETAHEIEELLGWANP